MKDVGMTRRQVLSGAAAVGSAVVGGAGRAVGQSPGGVPRTASGGARPADILVPPRLGLDTYTLHRTLTAKNPALRKDLWWVIGQLEELRLTGLQIDPSHFPGEDEATLTRLRQATAPKGFYVEFGMGGWTVERLRQRIKLTARFGGQALRTFLGDENSKPDQVNFFVEAAAPALHEAAETAEEYGVNIAVENHGDVTTAQMKELMERAGHPRVGVCFDTGNALFRDEDPLESARVLLPYAHSMHLKDWVMRRDSNGKHVWAEKVLGEGQSPVKQILELAVRTRPGLYIALEAPVWPGEDERETVEREWRHAVACARAANRFLSEIGASHVPA